MKPLDNGENFRSASIQLDELVEVSESDQDAEKRASSAEGYASALRYNGLIDHSQFKELTDGREKALQAWYRSDRRKALVEARKRADENNPWPMADHC
jgi:hypothetical protein